MKWIEPSLDVAYYVGENLRNEDCQEVSLSHGIAPTDAVVHSFLDSQRCSAFATELGEPCGMAGVVGNRVWMLATKKATVGRHARWQLLTEGRIWVDQCVQEVGPLHNYVYAKNDASIKWLKHLGFEVMPPEPYGPCAALFCHFWRDR